MVSPVPLHGGCHARFALPPGLSPKVAWSLIGNSLSVDAVREVLRMLPPWAG